MMMIFIRKPFTFLFFISFLGFAQTPCNSGFSGEYPCSNYDLMSHIPVSVLANSNGNPEGSDIWGWTDSTTNKEYVIAAMTNSTAFIDITDPINPVFLGRIDSNAGNNYWRDVKVYNNYAFIVADNVGAHGMQVFDLTRLRNVSNPPETFTADTVFTQGFNGSTIGSCHNIVINETKSVAYLIGCGSANGGGPMLIDISNPLNPVAIGEYKGDGYAHDAQAITYNGPDSDYSGKEILVFFNDKNVVFLNVSDASNITRISKTSYANVSYVHQGWFTEDQKYVLVGDEGDEQNLGNNTKTIILDVTDLDNPIDYSFYEGSNRAIDHNLYVKGNLVFGSNYTSGLRILDISNINSISEVGYFDTFPSNNNATFNGAWSVYPYFSSGNIVINDIERGVFIIKKTETLQVNEFSFGKSFSISPNPTKRNPTIKSLQNSFIKSVEVFNLLGKKVFSVKNINRLEYVLPLENRSKGLYFIKINSQTVKKLILH